ncbi:MAG: hypothetical protein ABIH21_02715 [Patescibacteria group bacterium]
MNILISSIFWFVLAVVFACLEIEAEGKYGWAEKMPTWYRANGFIARAYGVIMGGKPLTGYHSFMFFLPLLVFHSPFFQGVSWSMHKELMCFAMYFAWCPMWDFLWFVLNPNYTWKNFSKRNVWWHSKSIWIFGKIPTDYILGWWLSLVVAVVATFWGPNDVSIAENHIRVLGYFLALTIITITLAPLYHRWYRFMRKHDDRNVVKITHALSPDA